MFVRRQTVAVTLGWVLVVGAAATLAPRTAQAQDSDETERAKKYYKKGMEAFYKDDYAMALTHFKRANSIMTSGTLLYNISVAYSRLGKPEKALKFAKRAAGRGDLPDDTKIQNRARIRSYRTALRATRITGGSAGTASSDTATDSGSAGSTANRPPAGGSGSTRGGSGGNGLAWVGAGLGLAGVGGVTSAIVMNFQLKDKIDEMRSAEESGDYERAGQLYGEIDSQQTLGQVLLYSGAGVAAVGTTLLVIDLASSGSGRARLIRPYAGPTGDGWQVGLDLRF